MAPAESANDAWVLPVDHEIRVRQAIGDGYVARKNRVGLSQGAGCKLNCALAAE
jgi:hypothetical protein